MNLKQWLVSSLRTKLLVMFVILTVTPLVFVGIVSYVKSHHTVSEYSLALASLKAEQLSRDVDALLQDTQQFMEIGKQESTVQFLIQPGETYDEAKNILNLFPFYRETYTFSDSIQNMIIVNPDGKAISEDRGVYRWPKSPAHNPDYAKLTEQPTQTLIRLEKREEQTVISMTRAVTRDITKEIIGYVTIIMDPSVIEDMVQQVTLGNSGTFHIRSASGKDALISFKNQADQIRPAWIRKEIADHREGYFTAPSRSDDTFYVFHTSEMTGWKIVGKAPLDEIMKDAYEIRSLIFLSAACSILFTITLYYFISSRLIRPIRNLKETMKQAAFGNFDVKVRNESSDEIADLSNSFNIMIQKIKTLMDQSIAEQKQLKKAELRTLQTQINPHFLYNTLDTIIWMAEAQKSNKVIDMTKALSHFFRITLSKGKDWITLDHEIRHIQNYLIIQKMRYRDILDVDYKINEDILSYKILKLTLQPLVENAIYHGIKNKRSKGFIRIKADFNAQGDISIDIIDNGIGIQKEALEDIRLQLSDENAQSDGSGFGMVNVHKRIRLYYGEPFGLTVYSWYGSGTHVCLTIPAAR